MTLLKRLGLILPASLFAATLLIAGCSKSSTQAGLEKDDLDGDGIANIYDPDIDGDGIPNGSDPDIDGDGIPNDKDKDIDGDGKPNGKDPDPENNDPNYCDSIQVFGLNEEDTTGSEIVLTWYLQSTKTGGDCVVKEGVKGGLIQVTASAVGAADTKSEEANPLARAATRIKIPHTCVQGATVEVTYDFTEIADLINADPNAPGWKVKQRHTADPEECNTEGDELPGFGPASCPAEASGTYPDCVCRDGEKYDRETNSCWCDAPGAILIPRRVDGYLYQLYYDKYTWRNGYDCVYSDDQLNEQIVEWSWSLEKNSGKTGSLPPIRFGDIGYKTTDIFEEYCALGPTWDGTTGQKVISTAKLEDGTFLMKSRMSPVSYQCPVD